jgi:glycosyltransferase involved in cell wall biosynthesis
VRIACIATSKVPSRTANSIQVMKVCQALSELGHDLSLWLPGDTVEADWDALREHYGVRATYPIRRVRAIPGLRRYDFCLRAVLQARDWAADLLYLWPIQAAAIAAWLHLSSVLEVHDRPRGRLGSRLFHSYLNSRTPHRILPISRALESWLSSAYAMPLEPPLSMIAPDGIDLERYEDLPDPPEARRRLGLPQRFTAVYTGHLYPGRGVELVLDLAKRAGSISFVIAGGEPGAIEHWRHEAEKSDLDNMHFLGFVPNAELPFVQAAGDALLMPYARQIAVSGGGDTSAYASPMKMFEYMAAGRVILSSDLPVLREVLNEENAVLLPPEEPHAWQLALEDVKRNPQRAAKLATRACEDARRFTWVERARPSLEGLSASDEAHDAR